MRCWKCGRDVPPALFCTRCGAHQADAGGRGARRSQRFAANPDEEVGQASVVSTLFPHLGHHETNEFRWALALGLGLIFVLYLAGLIAGAILASAVLVPVLYVMYLYEVRVFRDAPLPILGMTFGGGLLLGAVVSILGNRLFPQDPVLTPDAAGLAVNVGGLLAFAIVLPVIHELVKPLPALLVRRPHLGETIDGLVLGVAAGLGFAAASTLVQFSAVITTLGIRTEPGEWLLPLASIAALQPLLHGSTTGAITAAIWRGRGGPRGAAVVLAVLAAVAAHVAFALGTALMPITGAGTIATLVWQAAVVGAMLIYVRWLLHDALLDEAASLGYAVTSCPSCDHSITAAGFCPMCGMALTAVSSDVRRARVDLDSRTGEA